MATREVFASLNISGRVPGVPYQATRAMSRRIRAWEAYLGDSAWGGSPRGCGHPGPGRERASLLDFDVLSRVHSEQVTRRDDAHKLAVLLD